MSCRMKPWAWLFVLLVWAAFAHPAAADECLSPSPSIAAGKKIYGPITVRALTPTEEQHVRNLLKSLAGRWQGAAQSFFCISFDHPDAKQTDDQTITAEADVDYYGNFILSAEFYSARKKAGSQETLRLFVKDHKLRYRYDNGAGDVELLEISEGSLSFFYRSLLTTGSGGSSRREHFVTVRRAAKGFEIQRRLYIQARLSSGENWRFYP